MAGIWFDGLYEQRIENASVLIDCNPLEEFLVVGTGIRSLAQTRGQKARKPFA
ncbi:hypothetical protein [Ruegeria atlantica]|uniref:hypothetical protein n=1 Tax=Ruegeria atlantica TaxID=81569 RepID=UPI001C2C70A0|nr:hypothetical protein [Ruegeria atlantica]